MALIVPNAAPDQVRLETLDGIAQRPMLVFVTRPVAARIVARRMRPGPVSEEFDQRRAEVGTGPPGGPARHRVDGKEIIAIDPDARNAESDGARGEARLLAPGHALRRGNGPLVVDKIEDDRG